MSPDLWNKFPTLWDKNKKLRLVRTGISTENQVKLFSFLSEL